MKILFVCRGNMFESQVAETLFKRKRQKVGHATSNFLAHSCGTWVEREGLISKK